MRHVVVMIASSYPRFPGDGIGSFMEPIAKGVAARGHEVHMVAPWHPAITRGRVEDGVFFHFYKYAPVAALNVFGYASGLRADTALKAQTWMAAPAALAAGWYKAWRVASKRGATVVHGHWVVARRRHRGNVCRTPTGRHQLARIGRLRRREEPNRGPRRALRVRSRGMGDGLQR
jgi:hypothetical protein